MKPNVNLVIERVKGIFLSINPNTLFDLHTHPEGIRERLAMEIGKEWIYREVLHTMIAIPKPRSIFRVVFFDRGTDENGNPDCGDIAIELHTLCGGIPFVPIALNHKIIFHSEIPDGDFENIETWNFDFIKTLIQEADYMPGKTVRGGQEWTTDHIPEGPMLITD